MCGIVCHVSTHQHRALDPVTRDWLSRRGPDALHEHTVTCGTDQKWVVTFASSVLSLRGSELKVQPVIDDRTGSVLCWNGEAWTIDERPVAKNDTAQVAEMLFELTQKTVNLEEDLQGFIDRISGPFAFVYYDAQHEQLFFGRDRLGRRSLLFSTNTSSRELTISSVDAAALQHSREVDTSTLHVVDLTRPELDIRPLHRSNAFQMNKSTPESTQALPRIPSDHVITALQAELSTSIETRVRGIPTYTVTGQSHDPSRVAVLFSGGLDCTLLARMVHDALPINQPVDLLNVAFENPRVVGARNQSQALKEHVDSFEVCPDRITGRSSFSELSRMCPNREWRFIAIDIPYHEFQQHRADIIKLMFPHDTEMDLSITAALYFASRGQGELFSSIQTANLPQLYTTTARVLLSGLGADELFGGYARHAAAFARTSFDGLNDELELDILRIGHRNLGRDDRVIAHWGRETRYPFLDERFVNFALDLPAWEKCGFRHDTSIPKHFEAAQHAQEMDRLLPDKMLLRCAAWKLGMKHAANEKKRAIQFGARTAKMHAGRTKGTDKIT